MIFHPPQKQNVHIPTLFSNTCQIECVNEFNLLGIIINKYLNRNSHLKYISKKIRRIIGILGQLKQLIPTSALRLICNTLILTHLNYGILCLGPQEQRIFKLQKKAARIISRAKYNAHTSPLF